MLHEHAEVSQRAIASALMGQTDAVVPVSFPIVPVSRRNSRNSREILRIYQLVGGQTTLERIVKESEHNAI